MIGTSIGVYRITAKLGAGGMGEVYRARDTKLDRDVAIKILPDSFAHDAERVARFEREAKVLAALNHPNIAQIYGLEERALVMELVEGPTLAERIAQSALPLDEALNIAKQIAEALEAAHEKGITHRDLKPANVKLRPEGTVKVLDFGLATAAQAPADGANATISPTLTLDYAATRAGMIMGTAAYMSPEQASGKPVDKRSDIWSFGVVLWEMLTGKRLFEGETMSHVLAAVLTKEPDWQLLPATTPRNVGKVLHRCLERDPKRRFHDIADGRLDLEGAHNSEPAETTAQATPSRRTWAMVASGSLVGLLCGLPFMAIFAGRTQTQAPTAVRFMIFPPEGTRIAPGPPWGSPLALSPDGRRFVFVASGKDGIRRLWVRALDALAAQLLPGTEGASAPFWSPDSESVGFFADNRLKQIAVSGGEAQTLCQCQTGGGGGTWSKNNVILFSPALAGESGLMRISSGGGTPVQVTTLDAARGATNNTWPLFLPDGRHFVYNIAEADGSGIYAGDLESPSRVRIMALDVGEMSTLGHASAGFLLYVQDRVLFARPFDAKRLALAGDPIRIVEGVQQVGPGAAAFSVSQNGVLAYWGGAAPGREQLTWVHRDGTRIAAVGAPGQYLHFSLAPDERRVAVTAYDEGARGIPTAIWLLDVLRGTATKFTFDWGAGVPVWSPDASRVAFSYDNRPGPPTLYLKPTSGGTRYDLLVEEGGNQPTDWSSDGRTIIHEHRFGVKMQNDLWLVSVSGEHKDHPFLATPANETGGRISPDGRWIAYTSDESGRNEIYVTSFPEPHGSTRISTDGGTQAEWRRDGRELYYRTPDRKLMAVSIKPGANFDAGTPQELFELPPEPPAWIQGGVDQRVYAPSADGQRFLISVPVGEESSAPITVVLNWTAGLKK